jgi:nitroreductase
MDTNKRAAILWHFLLSEEVMSVVSALEKRISIRAYKDTPIPAETLKEIFTLAQQSPSSCNAQAWQPCVVSGATKDALKAKFVEALMSGNPPNPDFNWDPKYQGVHRDRQFGSANALYTALGIERSDKKGRMEAMLKNWEFFDAPHAVFFTMDKYLDILGAVDVGIYAQSLSLLFAEYGISSCMQGALGQFPDPVRELLGLPEERGILFGMSFGYAQETAPANQTFTDRAELDEAVQFFD